MAFLFVDLELSRSGRFHGMAALRDGREQVWDGDRFERAHAELAAWLTPGDVLVGHNLLRFDREQLRLLAPDSPLLGLPALDTLELSVLAFPRRPYHRLAKNDKLVRDCLPNPLADVRASAAVLSDALPALRALVDEEATLLATLLANARLPEHARAGWKALLPVLGWPWPEGETPDLCSHWRGRACEHAPLLRAAEPSLALALVAAWLRVAHHADGSVLPAWVRRTLPETRHMLLQLRGSPCDHADCAWCRTQLCGEHWLKQVFGFDQFRSVPATSTGESLQKVLVERGLRGEPSFGILPTGGGKSLCFQVPAVARHRLLGQLTVVISPLQSLMKDQVDGLRERIASAQAIYGGLPTLLRPDVFQQVRDGTCGLLYLAPEQFRNASILQLLAQRDLGAIVFDEAHCLSQWGHDFRTDYPYVLKAVRAVVEGQGAPMPPVFLFTATSQADATQQILQHAQEEGGASIELFDGGSRRENLTYRVQLVPEQERIDAAAELLDTYRGNGSAIVFCGTRRRTVDVADALTALGHCATAYHAGLQPDERRELQDAFLANRVRIITATSAFGMGVDKPDVRLVVHLDMPGSLESYLQEAGRAGRDRKEATAVLLWAPGDAEARFRMGGLADLDVDDLRALWRGIKALPAEKSPRRERRVATSRELLWMEAVQGRFDAQDDADETRIKAAVNWLERARVLERRENITRVFSGRPLVPTLAQGKARIDTLNLEPAKARQWKTVFEHVYLADNEGLAADQIAEICGELGLEKPTEGGLRVLSILKQMADARLISIGQTFSAIVRKGTTDSSQHALGRLSTRELEVLDLMEEAGVGTSGEGEVVHLRSLAERLTRSDAACTMLDLARLLGRWATAGQGLAEPGLPPRFRRHRDDLGWLNLNQSLGDLRGRLRTRHDIADKVLAELLDLGEGRGQVLVSSELERLVGRIEADLSLRPRIENPVEAVRSALAWMHDLRVITVQNGLAIFRSAMTLDRDPAWPTLRGDEAQRATQALQEHQQSRVLRVHVMDAWARHMLEDPARAEQFRADWFALGMEAFKARWFARRGSELARPTTAESYERIITSLHDAEQQRIVTADVRGSHLVLAGPGSGKTRILVHRVAWLLRCQRVRASQILVVCYTRANSLELRRRLRDLVGDDGRDVSILTLHGVALRMVGVHRLADGGDLDLASCIPAATALLRGEALDPGEQSRQRDALLRGYSYLFVDEYQDIDEARYDLLSALAGRSMEADQRRLRVFAVGDDDQAIFTYEGAKTEFLRRFKEDYGARRWVVTRNYRNPRAILDLAQDLVADLPGRMKAGQRLVVNAARAKDPPVGPWATASRELAGHMAWHRAADTSGAAHQAMSAARRLIDQGEDPTRIGVLARTRPDGLHRLRLAAEALRVPFSWPLPSGSALPIGRVREVTHLHDYLRGGEERVAGSAIAAAIDRLGPGSRVSALRAWLEPNRDRTLRREHWHYDLLAWSHLERRARTIGEGVHLGTMHSAKGLEFDHVLLLDEGSQQADDEEKRLVYVALTRARLSLQLFSTEKPSPVFCLLRHPLLEVRCSDPQAHPALDPHQYDLIGRGDIWIDWLGRQGDRHPGHEALGLAQEGDAFWLRDTGRGLAIVDQEGRQVAVLAQEARERWQARMEGHDLRLRLVAVVRERADDSWRAEEWRKQLVRAEWWTGIWEARWRA